MSSLTDIPDALLDQICLCCDHDALPSLMRTCTQLHRLVLLHCVGRWSLLSFPITLDVIHQLVVLALRQPDIIASIRNRLSLRNAVRLTDTILLHGNCPEIVSEFIREYRLDIFAQITPGICLDMQLQRSSSVYPRSQSPPATFAQKSTRSNHFRTFVRHHLPQICRRFQAETKPASIGIDVDPHIDAILRQYARSVGDDNDLKYCAARSQVWARVFHPTVFELHKVPKWTRTADTVQTVLGRELSGSAALSDPAVLAALLRIGIRFEIGEYLELFPTQTADQFACVAPFLSPWNFDSYRIQAFMERLSPQSYCQHLRVMCTLHSIRTWLAYHGAYSLHQFLGDQRFSEFRVLLPHVLSNSSSSDCVNMAAGFLVAALTYGAPKEAVDLVLEYPGVELADHCLRNVNAYNVDRDLLRYVRGRLRAKRNLVRKRKVRKRRDIDDLGPKTKKRLR